MAELTSSSAVDKLDAFATQRRLRRVLERCGWAAMAVLLFVGLGSVFARMVFMVDAQGVSDPQATYNAFDVRYAEHPLASWLHLLPALIIAFTGPLQFVRRVRQRWPRWHRVAGRCYLIAGLIGAGSGFFIGALHPFLGLDGPGFNESMATVVFALLITWSLLSAYAAVRRRRFAAHREWMIRSWALMLAIATERILLGFFSVTTDVDFGVLFGTTFWMAGAINVAAAEIWIQLTRTPGSGNRHWKDLDARAAAGG